MRRLRPRTSTPSSDWSRGAELSTQPDNKLGTDEEWDFTEGELVACARAARHHRGQGSSG